MSKRPPPSFTTSSFARKLRQDYESSPDRGLWIFTWYVAPAGVVELAAEVLAESRQIWFPAWRFIRVR